MFLVDTSVFTRIVRPPVAAEMDRLAPLGFAYSALTGLELRFSASNAAEYDTFTYALGHYRRVAVESVDIDRADAVQRMLAADGLKGRKPPDLIIAAQAERLGLTVLHYDADFEFIARVTGQAQQWIIGRGSTP